MGFLLNPLTCNFDLVNAADGTLFWKEPVANYAALPAGTATGEVRVTLDTLRIWIWNGSAWAEPPTSLTIGTVDSQTKSANGAVIASNQLIFQTADASSPGLVSTGAQTLAGQKTFSSAPILSSLTASTVPYLDASKVLTSSSVTPTELGYVSGVTSAIQTQLNSKIPSSEKGAANGVATLDAGSKIPASQLPSTVMEFKGNWDASTNTPTLADGVGDAGDIYLTSVAGTQNLGSGSQTFAIGDWVIYNGTIWQKSINSNLVGSVNGYTGTVVLTTSDISEGTNQYFTDERAQDAVGGALTDTGRIDLTYNDGANTISADIVSDSITNTYINSSAAIARSKLAALTTSRAMVTDGSGFDSVSSVTSTELGYVSGATSNIQTQIDALNASVNNVIYVSPTGNDTTGTGGQNKPYATLTKAVSVATGATVSNQYVIIMEPGNYTEASGFQFKSFVHVLGRIQSGNPARVTFTGGSSTLLLGASPVLYIGNLMMTGAMSFQPDSTATGGATVKVNHCEFVDTLTIKRNTTPTMSFTFENNSFTDSTVNIESAYVEYDYSFAFGTINVTNFGSTSINELGFYGAFYTAISYTRSAGAAVGSVVLTNTNSYLGAGTVSASGSGVVVYSDADSLPKLAANLTLSGGATLNLLSQSHAVGYTPTTSGNWLVTPTTVLGALDELAARTPKSLTSGNIIVGNGSNVATSVSMSGDVTINNTGVTAIGSNKVTNAMLAQVATATFKGRTTAGTGNAEDLTATQATALLNNMVGDSGSGGTKGLAPAPASGDTAAGKFLKADGTWAVPAGTGITKVKSTFSGTSISQNTTAYIQSYLYNGGSAQTFGATGFGTLSNFTDGTRIRVIGSSDTNTITFNNTDASDGYLLNGTAVLGKGDVIDFEYDSATARMVETSRNF